MITVRTSDGKNEVYLIPVDAMTTAEDAARTLWDSVHKATKIHGGKAVLRTPDDGEFGFSVGWEMGPKQWAEAYVVDPEANAPEFTTEADDGSVRFTDLS